MFPCGERKPGWTAALFSFLPPYPKAFLSWHFFGYKSCLAAYKTVQGKCQAKHVHMYVHLCVYVLQTELPFSASPSGKWWEEGNIGLFFNFALDITSFGVCSKDISTREKLSRLLNHWIRIEMFSFIMILAPFMNQPDNCLSFAHVPLRFMHKGYSIIEN